MSNDFCKVELMEELDDIPEIEPAETRKIESDAQSETKMINKTITEDFPQINSKEDLSSSRQFSLFT